MINFPSNPEIGQEYTYDLKTWVWDGIGWSKKTFEQGIVQTETYTNTTPTPMDAIGIPQGTTFVNKTLSQMFDALLYPELFPVLTDPSYSLTANISLLQKVGAVVNLAITDNFNRGVINPLYRLINSIWTPTSNYHRTGEVSYSESLNGFKTILLGSNTFERTATYLQGEQPKSSTGNNYLEKYPAGSLTASLVINGVYPVLATKTSTTPEELALQAHGSTITNIAVIAGVAAVQIPEIWFANWATVKIWQLDTNSGLYKVIDRTSFSEDTIDIAGVAYKQFTSRETLGARTLQFTI